MLHYIFIYIYHMYSTWVSNWHRSHTSVTIYTYWSFIVTMYTYWSFIGPKFSLNDKLNLPQYCKRTFHIIISQCIQNIGNIHGWLYVTFWNLLLPYPHYNLSPSSSLTLFLNICNLKKNKNWQNYFTRICSPSKLHA